jgi:hypothetical protein
MKKCGKGNEAMNASTAVTIPETSTRKYKQPQTHRMGKQVK